MGRTSLLQGDNNALESIRGSAPANFRPSVLIESEGAIPLAPTAPAAYTLRGSTANFDVSYDSSLGRTAKLSPTPYWEAAKPISRIRRLFRNRQPRTVYRLHLPGARGRIHAGCSARGINCASWTGDGALENFLNCAEVAEVFMASQNAGWNCGASAGEGLSRILAFQSPPGQPMASGKSWRIHHRIVLAEQRPPGLGHANGTNGYRQGLQRLRDALPHVTAAPAPLQP